LVKSDFVFVTVNNDTKQSVYPRYSREWLDEQGLEEAEQAEVIAVPLQLEKE
jgi:hypothetical protein